MTQKQKVQRERRLLFLYNRSQYFDRAAWKAGTVQEQQSFQAAADRFWRMYEELVHQPQRVQ